eukprot:TRINITY_DN10694_c0_g1_i1.p2 TRINITY_DN10694_c0_g1~~TRINITY_DN10694_c0_g1_i1.p2  ORF type:complete len:102 (-),score=22.77 TRINITY_DN10694_c0_g1_i1:77-382(-)
MTKGTASFGKRQTKTHALCPRCGRRSYHKQKHRCAACAFGASARKRTYNWGYKAIRRNTTGTGRMRHLKKMPAAYKGIKNEQVKYKQAIAKQQQKNIKNHS